MGTFKEPKGGPLDIGEEYWEITILGGERYWDKGENIHSCSGERRSEERKSVITMVSTCRLNQILLETLANKNTAI